MHDLTLTDHYDIVLKQDFHGLWKAEIETDIGHCVWDHLGMDIYLHYQDAKDLKRIGHLVRVHGATMTLNHYVR